VARPEFGVFYREAHPIVTRALALTLADVALAEEAADEAMARCSSRWTSIQGHDNAVGWAFRTGLEWTQSKRRRSVGAPRFRASGPAPFPPATDAAMYAALQSLSIDLRAVIVCRYWFGWSVQQTADALGVRPATIETRLDRALNQIEVKLDRGSIAGTP
jgi:RNA polymerase sigma-70 factor (ECF subfamily)